MKVFIYTNRITGDVWRVDTKMPPHVDDETLLKTIQEYNENDNNENHVIMQEVDGIIEDAIKFLLGEKQYKRTYEIEEVCETLESIQGDIRDYQEELNEWHERYEVLQDSLDYAIESVKKLSLLNAVVEEIKEKQA